MKKNLLSVVIPTYNRNFKEIAKAIDSVQSQLYDNIETIVVDDNHYINNLSEEIANLCQKYENIIYIKQNGNKGACAARNLGIQNSNGEYIGFLDDDDTWEPGKALKQINILKMNKDIGMVYCKGFLIDENRDRPQKEKYYNSIYFKKYVTFDDLLIADVIGSTSQAIVRKECFNKCGGFDEKLLARQDYEMWIRISKEFKIFGLNEYLFSHFIHKGEQISKNKANAFQGYTRLFKLYKKDFMRNKTAYKNITYKIVDNSNMSKDFNFLVPILIGYCFYNPTQFIKSLYSRIYKKGGNNNDR